MSEIKSYLTMSATDARNEEFIDLRKLSKKLGQAPAMIIYMAEEDEAHFNEAKL